MHLYQRQGADGSWSRVPIKQEGLALCRSLEGHIVVDDVEAVQAVAAVVPFRDQVGRAVLIASPECERLLVNGERPLGNTHVLEDRDQIEIGLERDLLYFGNAEEVEVMDFPALGAQTLCARCTTILRPGDRAVRCPACKAWHHEGPLAGAPERNRSCWSYTNRCGSCQRPVESLIWHPEAEDDA